MTIRNILYEQLARALNNESFETINYITFSNESQAPVNRETATLSGEIGPRVEVVSSRNGRNISFRGMRSGAEVIDIANGDVIKAVSAALLEEGDNHAVTIDIGEINHTVNFDYEFDLNLQVGN